MSKAVLRSALCSGLVLLAAGPALAQAPAAPDGGLITITAEARRRLEATVSDASVTVEVHGRDLRGTATALAQRLETLLSYLRAQGAERLRTDNTGFDPELQEVRGQPDRIKGYSGRTRISFRTVPGRLPPLLSGSLESGATGILHSGAQPREEEIEAARQEVAGEATRVALARARAIAAAAKGRLGDIQPIEVDPVGPPAGFEPDMMLRMERAPRPIPPMALAAGETEVVVTVRVNVRLVPDAT